MPADFSAFLKSCKPSCGIILARDGSWPLQIVQRTIEDYNLPFKLLEHDITLSTAEHVKHLLFSRNCNDVFERKISGQNAKKKLIAFINVEKSSKEVQDYLLSDVIKCKKYVLLVIDDSVWSFFIGSIKSKSLNVFHFGLIDLAEKTKIFKQTLETLPNISETKKRKIMEHLPNIKGLEEVGVFVDEIQQGSLVLNEVDHKEELTFFQTITFLQKKVHCKDWDRVVNMFELYDQSKIVNTLQKNPPILSNMQQYAAWYNDYSELDTIGFQTNTNGFLPAFIMHAKTINKSTSSSKFQEIKTVAKPNAQLQKDIALANKLSCHRFTDFDFYQKCIYFPNFNFIFESRYVIDPLVVKDVMNRIKTEMEHVGLLIKTQLKK